MSEAAVKKYVVRLSAEERQTLAALISKGKHRRRLDGSTEQKTRQSRLAVHHGRCACKTKAVVPVNLSDSEH